MQNKMSFSVDLLGFILNLYQLASEVAFYILYHYEYECIQLLSDLLMEILCQIGYLLF